MADVIETAADEGAVIVEPTDAGCRIYAVNWPALAELDETAGLIEAMTRAMGLAWEHRLHVVMKPMPDREIFRARR